MTTTSPYSKCAFCGTTTLYSSVCDWYVCINKDNAEDSESDDDET